MIDSKMLESLLCPVGKSPLKYENNLLICESCGLIFPVKNGIPVLLIDEANLPEGVTNISELICQVVKS